MLRNRKLHQSQVPGNIRHSAVEENTSRRLLCDVIRTHLPGEHVFGKHCGIVPRQRAPANRDLILNDAAARSKDCTKPACSSASIRVLLPDPGPPVRMKKRCRFSTTYVVHLTCAVLASATVGRPHPACHPACRRRTAPVARHLSDRGRSWIPARLLRQSRSPDTS